MTWRSDFEYRGRWETYEERQARLAEEWWAAHPLPEALDLSVGERHGGMGRLLTEAEIREREAETGHRL